MSKTGTYVYVKGRGLVKVSERVPNVQVFDVYVPEGGYWSKNIGHEPVFVESRAHKRKLLQKEGLKEEAKGLTKREV